MISPNRPTDIDKEGTDLTYWVRRCCAPKNTGVYHLRTQGVDVALHPARGARASKDGKQIVIGPSPVRHKGRGWLQNLVEDIQRAITIIRSGDGDEIPVCLGDRIRDELHRRDSSGRRAEKDREHWVEWMEDDELPLLMGSWLFEAGMVHINRTVERVDKVDFYQTNDEFEQAAHLSPAHLFITLKRLARERMVRAGALQE